MFIIIIKFYRITYTY